jgi:hypothetical protein
MPAVVDSWVGLSTSPAALGRVLDSDLKAGKLDEAISIKDEMHAVLMDGHSAPGDFDTLGDLDRYAGHALPILCTWSLIGIRNYTH